MIYTDCILQSKNQRAATSTLHLGLWRMSHTDVGARLGRSRAAGFSSFLSHAVRFSRPSGNGRGQDGSQVTSPVLQHVGEMGKEAKRYKGCSLNFSVQFLCTNPACILSLNRGECGIQLGQVSRDTITLMVTGNAITRDGTWCTLSIFIVL